MRIVKILFLFIGLQAFCQQTNLTSVQGQSFQSRVIKKASEVHSFTASFVLSKHMEMMDESAESSGMVYYQNPDMLKWEYTEPYDYKVLYKNSKLYVTEDGEVREVDLSSNKMFQKIGEMITGSFSGNILKADDDFDIKYVTVNGFTRAIVAPRDSRIAGMFNEIWIDFTKENLIQKVRLIDPTGDFTEIKLKNIQVNQAIPKSVFKN